jgi:hypothetical protein
MVLRMNGNTEIENLQHYPVEVVETVRALLAVGAPANPDPHRKNFYDVENGTHVFYIHVCPSGKVLLLATWPKYPASMPAEESELLAQPCA